jgi:hypothetical protein
MTNVAVNVLIILSIFGLMGCQDRYRYPCQNPANKHTLECTIEICKETRSCPTSPI